ncbi:hypothetical protein QWY16_02180 [Planococcus shenhongbingii]|uniref:Uncharacterized protein n=1 Tax=Planococcus shenhongbingii TaxID=3058398 RepID=A0ABT8NGN7_9BACL|nr:MULTISPECIES: hypothetical protein [unclassified Planococcus (in: firmicutes)]MDN7246650.1 hypothetical protein [Planococcus sp. N017]WKA58989.1 hypothetical protein QWY16_02180 [Planococcus sp. N016]
MKRKNLVNGMILAFSVIFIRYLDVHVYDMNLVVTLILIVVLIAGLMKIVDRFPSLEEPVGKRAAMITNLTVVIVIFLCFFGLNL